MQTLFFNKILMNWCAHGILDIILIFVKCLTFISTPYLQWRNVEVGYTFLTITSPPETEKFKEIKTFLTSAFELSECKEQLFFKSTRTR